MLLGRIGVALLAITSVATAGALRAGRRTTDPAIAATALGAKNVQKKDPGEDYGELHPRATQPRDTPPAQPSSGATEAEGFEPPGLQDPEAEHLPIGIGRPQPVTTNSKPLIFFLFMVYEKINNEEVWSRFFAPAVRGVDYVALVHCKSASSCSRNIRSTTTFEIIPTVETRYCMNLVSGMNALLAVALQSGGSRMANPMDKFVFVSDSTLPIKPFTAVQQALTVDAGDASDFCVFPRNEWAEVTDKFIGEGDAQRGSSSRVAVKAHQWITLSRRHAEKAVRHAQEHQDLMEQYQLNNGFRNQGCLDEFWYFTTLFEASLKLSTTPEVVHLEGFRGGPLTTGSYEIQGQCDTFVHWRASASGTFNNMTRLANNLVHDAGTELDMVSDYRPASIRRLSKAAIVALRESPFLFARKVDEKCAFSGCDSLTDAFDRLVFSNPPQELEAAAQFRGTGTWLDNRRSAVSILSTDGTLTLSGVGDDLQAKGSYCRDQIDVAFSNGYRATGSLSADGMRLHWSNGVVWERVPTSVR
mmetsp:Transcript_47741/g.103905  ORF Transcript_47741/g.103905 Transcript_47741/m.103905 type:complete len:529 (-) Transcript_47741:28-1614(-)